MKKSKLSITLVTSFIAAMALTACKEVTASKEAIVSFTPYGSKESISLITNDVYNSYRGTSSGVTKFYEKILEVLIRYEFDPKGNNFEQGELKYSEIESWAENQVKEQKDKAKADAKSNGTNYDDEWDKILESNNVEDAKELKQKFIYQKEKEVITNWYADNTDNAEALKNEFIGIDKDNKPVDQSTVEVKAAMPYHIRHILVKVDEAGNSSEKFYKGTVTEAQAKLLSDTVTTLASGKYTFSQVASMYSEDGSKDSGGDVGIVTNNATSGNLAMVNEFQLGIYAYDNLYTAHKDDPYASVIQSGLGISGDVKTALNNALGANITEVPYEAFVKIGKYAAATADKEGNKLAKGSETLYPRNILWNKYFNLHNVFVIKNAKNGAAKFGDATAPESEFKNLCATGDDSKYDASLPRFDANDYLKDENGNVIIGVRSQYGIHFMIIEESMYDYAELATYYSTKLPNEEGYSSNSYVGFIQSESTEDYKKRADDVKSKITSFDATYDYRLYQYLTGRVEMTFASGAEGLDQEISQYIKATKENNAYKQEDGLDKVWRTYTELIQVQKDNRSSKFSTRNAQGAVQTNLTRLVSEKVADAFIKLYEGTGVDAADYLPFAEGGDYYYYA